MTGRGVSTPRTSLDSATLNTGSSVFTVCVRLMATAANDRFAAMWPNRMHRRRPEDRRELALCDGLRQQQQHPLTLASIDSGSRCRPITSQACLQYWKGRQHRPESQSSTLPKEAFFAPTR